MTDPLRLLALWALVHETADEGWKAAVARGGQTGAASEDRLAALVNDEKERLRASLASQTVGTLPDDDRIVAELSAIRFEISALRGRLESMEATLDAIRSGPGEKSREP
jgi:hypothetical protein